MLTSNIVINIKVSYCVVLFTGCLQNDAWQQNSNIPVDDGWSSDESEAEECSSDDGFGVGSDEDDSYAAFGGKWYAEKDFVPSIPPFTSESGSCDVPLTRDSQLDYFLSIFDDFLS